MLTILLRTFEAVVLLSLMIRALTVLAYVDNLKLTIAATLSHEFQFQSIRHRLISRATASVFVLILSRFFHLYIIYFRIY